jgi:hypothetical protein
MDRVHQITKLAAYVGIPAADASVRQKQLLSMASGKGRKSARLQKAAQQDVSNAELLFIFSKGSPIRKQPARPVLEPAVQASGNKESITRQITASVKASLAGDKDEASKRMTAAAIAGQTASRRWFTDSRNGWAPLAESTKRGRAGRLSKGQRAKATGEDGELLDSAFTPGVDTGAMRAAIVGITRTEE